MPIKVLEVDEERPAKDKPPTITPVAPGTRQHVVVERSVPMGIFNVFGRNRSLPPRQVTLMSRIESLKVVENLLSSGKREERKLLPLCSDHPEEALRYWNYARLAEGNVLVYGVGVGLFQQMWARASRIVVVENDPEVADLALETKLLRYTSFIGGQLYDEESVGRGYDFIFFDCIPRISTEGPGLDTLIHVNRIIAQLKKRAAHDGKIALRGYRDLIISFQRRCQEIATSISKDIFGSYVCPPKMGRLDAMFFDWAVRNKRRVLEKRDFKFVNAWARHTALTTV